MYVIRPYINESIVCYDKEYIIKDKIYIVSFLPRHIVIFNILIDEAVVYRYLARVIKTQLI
jgi:hypothetical protein